MCRGNPYATRAEIIATKAKSERRCNLAIGLVCSLFYFAIVFCGAITISLGITTDNEKLLVVGLLVVGLFIVVPLLSCFLVATCQFVSDYSYCGEYGDEILLIDMPTFPCRHQGISSVVFCIQHGRVHLISFENVHRCCSLAFLDNSCPQVSDNR